MTRVLPAHVAAAALAIGLACSDLARVGASVTVVLVAAGALAIALGKPRASRLAYVALLVALREGATEEDMTRIHRDRWPWPRSAPTS